MTDTPAECVSYEFKCEELAEHFLRDEPCRNDPELYKIHIVNLARHIQHAVEEWFKTDD